MARSRREAVDGVSYREIAQPMDIPFLYNKAAAAPRRVDIAALLIILLHAAALVLFVVKPLEGAVLFCVGLTVAVALGRPLPILLVSLALLWVNDPLADLYPLSQYTAWKDVLLLVVFIGWMLRSLVLRRPVVLDSPISRPLLLLVIAFLVGCINSPSMTHAVLGLKACVFYSVWYFVLPEIIRSKRDARALVMAVLFGTVCLSFYNFWAVQQPAYGIFPAGRDGRVLPGALMVHWSPSSSFLPPGILFGMVIAPRLRMWRRILVNIAVVIGVGGLVVTSGRAAWGILLITTLILSALGRRAGLTRILLVAVIVAGVIQTQMSLDVTERAASAFESNDVSADAREAEFTTVTLPFVLSHPFGAGTGSMSAQGSAKVWAGGSDVDFVLQKGIIHNGFLLVAIEIGWVGLAAYIWMLIAAMAASWRAYKKARDPFVKDLALSCLGIVFFFTAMNFALSILTTALIGYDIWVFLGLITLLPRLDDEATNAAGRLASSVAPEPVACR
jgi:hypothetical protein